MKNRFITAVIFITVGLLYIFGPHTLFKVCQSDDMIMTCHWSVQAELGVGILFLLTGLLYLFARNVTGRLLLSLQSIGIYIVGILIPAVLIGGCENKDMACQSLTFPSIYFISVLGLFYLAGNIYYLIRSYKKG